MLLACSSHLQDCCKDFWDLVKVKTAQSDQI